jgi:hypothetical protein
MVERERIINKMFVNLLWKETIKFLKEAQSKKITLDELIDSMEKISEKREKEWAEKNE